MVVTTARHCTVPEDEASVSFPLFTIYFFFKQKTFLSSYELLKGTFTLPLISLRVFAAPYFKEN
jgi:hypothetical protein